MLQSAVQDMADRRSTADNAPPMRRFSQTSVQAGMRATAPAYNLLQDDAEGPVEGARISKQRGPVPAGPAAVLVPTLASKKSATGGRMAAVKRAAAPP